MSTRSVSVGNNLYGPICNLFNFFLKVLVSFCKHYCSMALGPPIPRPAAHVEILESAF